MVKRNCSGKEDRQAFCLLNQLLTGHTKLNSHRARFDNTVSKMCKRCNVEEDVDHYLFKCEAFKHEKVILDNTIEDVLNREDLQSVGDINLKVMVGLMVNRRHQYRGQNELMGALMNYIRGTKRFY